MGPEGAAEQGEHKEGGREGVRVQNEVWVLMKERERKERELMRCGS